MHIKRGSGLRRGSPGGPGSHRALIAALLAIPLAIGLVLGVTFAFNSARSGRVSLSAEGFRIGHRHFHHGWWGGRPPTTGGSGNGGINLNQTPDQAAQSMNCTLQVPADPLSARGLATPYILGDGCTMANTGLQAFVEADIINPATGAITVYNPLVITQGTTPAAAPVVPTLAPGDVVGIMFGFNGTNLLLTGTGDSLEQGNCVNGLGRSLFTQVAFCNSPAFYRVANRDIARGLLRIPALGTGSDGRACPDVRSFAVVDQDQSDNVVTTYLLTPSGQTAPDTAANEASLAGAVPQNNGSDNALVNKFMDPALGCAPYEFPDQTVAAGKSGSQITDELLAAADQRAPTALVPLNDPMTEINGAQSIQKTDLFRLGVDQPPVSWWQRVDSPANYCKNMINIGEARTALDKAQFSGFASPVPDTGSNLFTFLAARLSASWQNLGCGALLNAPDPVNLTLDANGVATDASFSPLAIGTLPGGVAPSASPSATATAQAAATATATPAGPAAPTSTATATATATATGTATGTGTPTSPPTGTAG